MHTKKISMFSGAALLALTSAAWAGPTSVASALIAPPQTQTEPVAYRYRHHYRHYGWYHHRYRHYGWHYYNPVAAATGAAIGLATVPFALATGGYYYGYPYYYY